jgi:uncharacterized membrane protein YphA (DoxX/SURF4 family)
MPRIQERLEQASYDAPPQAARADAVRPATVDMRHPDRWLAVLRVIVGLWFLKAILTKLTIGLAWGVVPLPMASDRWIAVMPKILARYAAENPFPAYRSFLLDTVIPNAAFAHLTALGEVAVGLSLTLGLLTVLGASAGVMQVIFYGLAVQHMSDGQRGFHVLLLALMLAFLFARAGRRWGLDGWLRRRHPQHLLARLPLG